MLCCASKYNFCVKVGQQGLAAAQQIGEVLLPPLLSVYIFVIEIQHMVL
jgi:hypothetical protein